MVAMAVQLAAAATLSWQGVRAAAMDRLVAASICHAGLLLPPALTMSA
jgi:hypothetical protein